MEINFFFLVIAIILGFAIYKQFNFKNLKFEKPALAILYIIVFVSSIFLLIRGNKSQAKK